LPFYYKNDVFFCWSIIIHPSSTHEDTKFYIFRGNDLVLLGSRDVIGHVTIGLGIWFPIGVLL